MAAIGTSTSANSLGAERIRYGISGVVNLFNSMNIPTEGGTKTVIQLPASLFQLDFL